ncbi:MAG: VacJ family lipoprotein [Rickettsiaceae bacterium]|nr:VacJ family lipoprotein [Rickettsiaceae bacterium]
MKVDNYQRYILNISLSFVILFCFSNYMQALDNSAAIENYSEYEDNYTNDCDSVNDPFESFNRKILDFNMVLNRSFINKFAKVYRANTSPEVKIAFGNFINNLYMPNTIVNSFLQGDINNGVRGVWKMVINSTFGMFGFRDVAIKVGITANNTTFGETLARYGFYRGPYIMLPIFGPSTVGNSLDMAINFFDLFNPVLYNTPTSINYIIKTSSVIVKLNTNRNLLTDLDAQSADLYSTLRSMYWQNLKAKSKYPSSNRCQNNTNIYKD